MSFVQAVARFTSLAEKVAGGTTARSENDLSSNLSALLKSIGLATVIDTSVSATGRKRPDILAYVSPEDADLVLPAEIVFEAKKPEETAAFSDLSEAGSEVDAILRARCRILTRYPATPDFHGNLVLFQRH
jgi:hypothetical protein